tara:strand:- start:852 stop:1319 length:468 start_codon:yes stop_codon:yes gene_type:complete
MEVIDIGVENLEPISVEEKSGPSVNFGPGIELLMNDKNSSAKEEVNLNLDDLDNLEKEMNDLSSSLNNEPANTESVLFAEEPKIIVDKEINDSNLGSATKESMGNTTTWDGFTKMNEVPNVERTSSSSSSKMNEREKRRKKRMMIKKLEEWNEKN